MASTILGPVAGFSLLAASFWGTLCFAFRFKGCEWSSDRCCSFSDCNGLRKRCYGLHDRVWPENWILLQDGLPIHRNRQDLCSISDHLEVVEAGRKKRILFPADRSVLVDQTMVNDFRPFGAAMAKLSTGGKTIEREDGSEVELTLALDRKQRIDTAYEVYLGLYQAITGPEERQRLYREFSPGFFNLILIDECHRGARRRITHGARYWITSRPLCRSG
jgi:Type III restriction enzyme, res subunit